MAESPASLAVSCASALIDVLPRLGRILSEALQEVPAGVRLTPSQYRALAFLAERECLSSELARCLGVTRSAVTTTVDILAQHGLAERLDSPHDRRCVRVRITAGGQDALALAQATLRAHAEALLARLESGECAALLRGLAALRDELAVPRAVTSSESERQGRAG